MGVIRDFTKCLAIAGVFTFAGCSTIQVELPRQCLMTSTSAALFKATTADNAILIIEKNQLPESGGDLEFWVDAIQNEFVRNRGYVLLESEDTKTTAGVEGKQMVYESTVQGQVYRYLIAIFLESGPVVRSARFTAEKEKFLEHVEAVKDAIRTTRG